VDAADALVSLESAQQLPAKDCAGCAGHCHGQVHVFHSADTSSIELRIKLQASL
jgi:hypothetical protein